MRVVLHDRKDTRAVSFTTFKICRNLTCPSHTILLLLQLLLTLYDNDQFIVFSLLVNNDMKSPRLGVWKHISNGN